MISAGLAWLKDMATARMNPPADVMRTAEEHHVVQEAPRQPLAAEPPQPLAPRPASAPVAATGMPAWARHSIPPNASASFRGPEFGCVGLCPGGTCEVCDGLADEISKARRIKDPVHRATREGDLRRRINALKEGR